MSTTLKQSVCVNCNLLTRADQKMCQHYHPRFGNHVWATKAKELKSSVADRIASSDVATQQRPTPLDLNAYERWLRGAQADLEQSRMRLAALKGVIQ